MTDEGILADIRRVKTSLAGNSFIRLTTWNPSEKPVEYSKFLRQLDALVASGKLAVTVEETRDYRKIATYRLPRV